MALDPRTVPTILRRGPRRVLIDRQGRAMSPQRAIDEFGVMWNVVFIRYDGWSLGAPANLEAVALKLWPKHWVAFMRQGDTAERPFREYDRPADPSEVLP